MSIRSGKLTTRMIVQAKTQTMNDGGEWISAWTDVAPVWVELWAKSGSQRQIARANQDEVFHGVRMRPFPGLTSKNRLKSGSRTFAITFVDDTVLGQLTLDLTEVVGQEAQ